VAYVQDPSQQDQQQTRQQQGAGVTQQIPTGTGGTGSTISPGAAGASGPITGGATQNQTQQQTQNQAQTQNADRPTSSGSFTNLKNYLNANQGSNLGQQINQQFQNQANQFQGQVGQAYNQFDTSAQQGRNQYNTGLMGAVLADPTAAANNQTLTGLTPGDINPAAGSGAIQPGGGSGGPATTTYQNPFNSVQNMRTGTYTGPQDLANAQQLQGSLSQLQQTAGLTATEPGRFALLQQMYNTPGYNTGQQTLDNLILQSNPTQSQALSQSRQHANQAQNQYATERQQAQQQAQQYSQEAASTQQQTQKALDTQQQSNIQALQNQVSNDQAAQSSLWNQISTQLPGYSPIPLTFAGQGQWGQYGGNWVTPNSSTVNVNPTVYNALNSGLGLNAQNPLYNVFQDSPLSQFINQAPQANLESVATPEQYAQYAALSKLAGTNPTLLTNSSNLGTYNATNTPVTNPDGTVTMAGITYNPQNFQTALTNQQQAVTSGIANDPQRQHADWEVQQLYLAGLNNDTQAEYYKIARNLEQMYKNVGGANQYLTPTTGDTSGS
jgi:hypothetical protein